MCVLIKILGFHTTQKPAKCHLVGFFYFKFYLQIDSILILRNNDFMLENIVHNKANNVRDVIRYLKRFKNALIVIYIDEEIIDAPVFINHIKDICLIHEAGIKLIVVPGASKRIDEILQKNNIKWTIHNNCRITTEEAMPLIKMAAFDVSNQVMTAFAGEKTTAVIGNWVRARSKGVIDGFDYASSGEIDKLEIESINTILQNGFIPIFPCIGWSIVGKPYNISSTELSEQIAIHLHADKLFFLVKDAVINKQSFIIPKEISLSPEENVPALTLNEVDLFLKTNEQMIENIKKTTKQSAVSKILRLLKLSKSACSKGVARTHILNGSFDGSIPCEIFSDFGSGTMIYKENYGKIRPMNFDDIGTVLALMQPFVKQGILLPRTKEELSITYKDYIVYELDGAIRACASLIPYPDGQMEIAGVTVDQNYSNMGIGPKLINTLIEKGKTNNAKSIFLLTTQTSDWFENLNFKQDSIDSIPNERQEKWSKKRGSKVMRLEIK